MKSVTLSSYEGLNKPDSIGEARQVLAIHHNRLIDDVEEVDERVNIVEDTVSGGVITTTGLNTMTGGIVISTNVTEYNKEITLTATEIVGNSTGDIGHASGAVLVESPGSDHVLEFVSAILIYDYLTAAYTAGGDDNVIQLGTVAQTAAIAGTDLLEGSGDKIVMLTPLGAVDLPMTVGTTLNFKGTALTQPGTAAGVLRVNITYRVHTTGL